MAMRFARISMRWARIATTDPGSSDLDRANELAGSAATVFSGFPAEQMEHARSLVVLSHVRLRCGDTDSAAGLAEQALNLLIDDRGTAAATAHLVLAEVALARSQDTAPILRKAEELLETRLVAPDRESARAWRELGDLWGRTGSRDEQAKAYRRALEAVGIHVNMPGSTASAVLTR
jgi:hypothetical protein